MANHPSVRIEGGLFGPDFLDALLAGDLPGQRPADFGLEAKRSLVDEVAGIFQDARAYWRAFQNQIERHGDKEPTAAVTWDSFAVPFFRLLGYDLQRVKPGAPLRAAGGEYPISHVAGTFETAPPIHVVAARQRLGHAAAGSQRRSPHSLVQEYLNRSEPVWGIVTNGESLRLLRDTMFTKRQAMVEFDLRAIFEESRFNDFTLLYRLLHRSRLPVEDGGWEDCLLETYYQTARAQGDAVRNRMRDGVEECIRRLANGFLSHGGSRNLVKRLNEGRLDEREFFRQILVLVYRFLFLLVAEDRRLLGGSRVYHQAYGIGRLRDLADTPWAKDGFDDLWQSLRVLWDAFRREDQAARLGVAPLNGALFRETHIDVAQIANRDLLEALYELVTYQELKTGTRRRVNFAALNVEELGSIYESLLDFHPQVASDPSGRLTFDLVPGVERKTTGSYYTPDSLVAELVKSALVPVVEKRLRTRRLSPRNALLSIKVVDPACGSGHFLLAAARALGRQLAEIDTGADEPSVDEVRAATREVIAHCIYGVDKNELAVDLCRVALWIESHAEKMPLTFLDRRIRRGDALIGVFALDVLTQPIPDGAFQALEGDDREVARAVRKGNANEGRLFGLDAEETIRHLAERTREIDAIPDDTPDHVREKGQRFEALQRDPLYRRVCLAADLWTAAFFQRYTPGRALITGASIGEVLNDGKTDDAIARRALDLSSEVAFFHWPLAFPEVFAEGGFDVVLGNPPWEHVELKEQEFFSVRMPTIAQAPNAAARARLIRDLESTGPELYEEFLNQLRIYSAQRSFFGSTFFPLTGRGRINTYAVFAERGRNLLRPGGRAGIIVPSGIATDDTTKFFFQDLTQTGSLASLYDFQNGKKIFPAIDTRINFSLLTLRSVRPGEATAAAEYVFFALGTADLERPEKRFTLTPEEVAMLNPNTGNCPIFRSQADAELTKAIYRQVPILWREVPDENPWRIRFKQGLFNMAGDSHHFRTQEWLEKQGCRREGNVWSSGYDRFLPLYEAKMLHQFDHRWATYDDFETSRLVTPEEKADPTFVVQPRYWVREAVVESAIPLFPEALAAAVDANDPAALRELLHDWAVTGLGRPVHSRYAETARRLQADYPLSPADAEEILAAPEEAEDWAMRLLDRHSPKWLLGWRDITRATDRRTTIASMLPKAAVGDTFLLIFSRRPLSLQLCLLANLNSFVLDYCARQKVGGVHMKYNVFRQLPVLPPGRFAHRTAWSSGQTLEEWIGMRALRLVNSAVDVAAVAQEVGLASPPVSGLIPDREEVLAELDAAFLHLYLPSTVSGLWIPDVATTSGAAFVSAFPKPRLAAEHLLKTFVTDQMKPSERETMLATISRVLRYYDAMTESLGNGAIFDPEGLAR